MTKFIIGLVIALGLMQADLNGVYADYLADNQLSPQEEWFGKDNKDIIQSKNDVQKNERKKIDTNKVGDKVVVTFDYKDTSEDVHELDVNLIFREWEILDASEKEAPEGTQWLRGKIVLAATVEGSNDTGKSSFPTVVQPIYPYALNSDSISPEFIMGRSANKKFESYFGTIKPGDVKTGEFELLVPEDNPNGSIIKLNMGLDQVWFEL